MRRSNQLRIRNKFVIGIVVVLVGIFVLPRIIYMIIGEIKDNIGEIKDNQEQNIRKEICKESILESLKSPGTAIFGEKRVYGNQHIKNYVDSQNSYGALLRKYFLCGEVRADSSIIFFFEDEPAYNTINQLEFSSD